MSNNKFFKIADFIVFAGIVAIGVWSLSDKTVAAKIDSKILPEERNEGFYEVLDSASEVVEGEEADGKPSFYRCSFLKGAFDGEIVTEDDWKLLSNKIKYQIQNDKAVIDFHDGTGIIVEKSEFPIGTYGTLWGIEIEEGGEVIDVSDYSAVMTTIKDEGSSKEKPLRDISDFYSYLKALSSTDYTVFIALSDEGTTSLNNKLAGLINSLGTKINLNQHEDDDILNKTYYRNGYYAVLDHGQLLGEKASEERLKTSGKLSDGTDYEIESAGYDAGEPIASIKIAGKEYAVNGRGMNFVVYDEKSHEVVDQVCFDTCEDLWCYR